uniref:N-6 DNA methylase n=1 Tax=Nonomuraea lactucae TaxID=2249762 RepID=UPI0013B3F555
MNEDATVVSGDIARLAGVGRAAVSNWRRRFADFPRPVGGTAANPLYSLAEVEAWLRKRGKLGELPVDELTWQVIRNAADDLRLPGLVGSLAAQVASGRCDPGMERDLLGAVTGLVAERGKAWVVEFLHERYLAAHSRRVQPLSREVATLVAGLIGKAGTVLDPSCGFGELLLEASAAVRVLGQERDEVSVRLALSRLLVRGRAAEVRPGHALRQDAFPGVEADVVVCNPPFGERGWGYEELAHDPRWEYGLPPRGEPELAWVQHCLAHVRPGGLVAVLMPQVAAGRRSGRRIRSRLLRAGALQAVIAL